MKTRRHHNNTGLRQIKRGKTTDQVEAMARRLGIGKPPKCSDCGIHPADPPSKMCSGCEAYREHLR